jgi:hypothetical protein
MDSESKRRRLLGALRHLTPGMKETLRTRKEEGLEQRDRPDFMWHSFLQSFATMGNARGRDGLVGNKANYNLVTFEALSGLYSVERFERLQRPAAALNRRTLRLHESILPQQASRGRGTKDEKGEAAYLFGVSFSSVKRATLRDGPFQPQLRASTTDV